MHTHSLDDFRHSHIFLGDSHERNERKTWAVIAICAAMMVAEIVGGLWFGSVALIADGLHMSTHAGALLIAALAYTYSRRHVNDQRLTFGTGKFGDLAAFTSAIVLAIIALLIGYESVDRLVHPVPIAFNQAIPIAVVGLGVNLLSALLLRDDAHHHHGHTHNDPARINGMSERLIVSHYENNYGGAVKRLNLIEEKLAELNYDSAPGFLINGLKREQLIAMNSMILHELFFDGLGEESEPGTLRDAITRDFGSYERWRSEFVAMGKALGGGSGWVLLSWSPHGRKLVNQWASDHCHTLAGGTPILALDMYEHSYHIDFGAKAATYVDTFMSVIRWQNSDHLIGEIVGRQLA